MDIRTVTLDLENITTRDYAITANQVVLTADIAGATELDYRGYPQTPLDTDGDNIKEIALDLQDFLNNDAEGVAENFALGYIAKKDGSVYVTYTGRIYTYDGDAKPSGTLESEIVILAEPS